MNVTSALGWILGSQTPSGAIDVIAIRKPDGTVNCSPFHVKLPINRSNNNRNIVKLAVNGKEIKLSMKLGSAGEAFFIERTKKIDDKTRKEKAPLVPAVPPNSPTSPPIQNLPSFSTETDSPSGIRRVQSEGHLRSSRTPLPMQPSSVMDQNTSPIDLSTKNEYSDGNFDRTSKRRAFTFAGDDLDSLTCPNPKDDGNENSSASLTEENLLNVAINIPNNSTTIVPSEPLPSSSQSEWTWTWGTLPIKASDPSIADLQSLTDLVLREKFNSKISSTNQMVSENLLSPLAEGKASIIAPSTQSSHHELQESEYRLVPTDIKNVDEVHENGNDDDTAPLEDSISKQSNSDDLPEPKYPHFRQPHLTRLRSHTLSDDYRHTSSSPGIRENLNNDVKTVELSPSCSTSVSYHISARAATIASALGSDRILSLCAHILSSEQPPRLEEDLISILKQYAVSPEEFSNNPLDILNNPNLVVVVNNLLIPWRLVHAHLIASPSAPRDAQTQENLTVPANEKTNLWWAGRTVTNWGSWHINEETKQKNVEFPTILPIPSSSRSGSVRSITSNAEGKSESRRASYGNPDEDDFDHYECMSEGSSAGPSWSQSLSGNPTLEDMDTPGAHLWNKETLNWNSADDFQRLLNEYTTADAVPDLLKPYVTNSNLWPTMENDVGIISDNSSEIDKLNTSNHLTSVSSPPLITSTSHDSGLSMIASKSLEMKKQNSQEEQHLEFSKPVPISSPTSNPLPDGKTMTTKVDNEALKDDEEVVEFLSLEDISPDEILPGPAREVYDGSDTESFYSLNLDDETSSLHSGSDSTKNINPTTERKYRYRKTLVPTQEQIKSMDLQDGMNEIVFEIAGNKVTAHIFVWPDDAKIVIADIEGALFVSGSGGGALGMMMSFWGSGTSARRETHEGLAQLFDSISSNGYRFLYITTKPDTSQKEQLLKSSARGSARCVGLPPGPVFLPPNALIQTIGSERTDLFKAAALRGVRTLFPSQHNPYHAAFGANARDVRTFDRCEIPLGRTFLVNEKGEVNTMTNISTKRSFTEMNSLLHQLFPSFSDTFARAKLSHICSHSAAPVIEDTFSDFNYWRIPPSAPPPLPLPLPSPQLKKK